MYKIQLVRRRYEIYIYKKKIREINSHNKIITILRLPVDAMLFTEQNNVIETRCCIVHKTK